MTGLPPRLNPKNRDRHIEWLYARSQALARAQSHYLLLLLLVAAYSVVVHFSAAGTAPVNMLGLDVPKALVEVGAVSILSVVTLGFFGAAKATELTYAELGQLLEEPELCRTITRNAYQEVRSKYIWSVVARQWEDLFCGLMRRALPAGAASPASDQQHAVA